MLALASVGCATGGSRASPSRRVSDQVMVARVVGTSVRERMHRGFVVLPRFLSVSLSGPATAPTPADEQLALLDALRDGASARWADTSAFRDSVRLASLPDSSLTVVTLTGPVVISGDTARVPVVYRQVNRRPRQMIFYTVEEYILARAGSQWKVLRRRLMYAT